jgi:hypothetical protein
MTNNRTPDMPEEIWAMTGCAYADDGQAWYTGAKINLDDEKYIRADLIKPEPVADLDLMGFRFVVDSAVPAEEIHIKNERGALVGVIKGITEPQSLSAYMARLPSKGHLRPAVPMADRIAKLETALRNIVRIEDNDDSLYTEPCEEGGTHLSDEMRVAIESARKALEG